MRDNGTPRAIADLLRAIHDERLCDLHDVQRYAAAFETSDLIGECVLGAGTDSLLIRLEGGDVLKISRRELTTDMGHRPFDLPILRRGRGEVRGRTISWFVQPWAEPAEVWDFSAFHLMVKGLGYFFNDPGFEQLGKYQGTVLLVDPFAVEQSRSTVDGAERPPVQGPRS
jgi:hypothetical protein